MTDNLKRRIGPGLLTAYGVGVMVGAGIYVLVGAVVANAGIWAPLAFVLAGVIAVLTALSYAEFSTRLPEAAGEAAYIAEGLRSRALSLLVGLAIVVAGTVSAAAVLRGGGGYLGVVVPIDPGIAILGLGVLLTGIAIIGVLESLTLAAIFSAVEIGGLALVIWAGFTAPVSVDAAMPLPPLMPGGDFAVMAGVMAGAVLAFFAFIGFEDIVNMAEEVRDPDRTLPRAILWSLIITSAFYALVTLAAVRAVPLADLGASDQPLALVWQVGQGGEARFLSAIAVVAALNGVLAQIVMAARVIFGLGARHRGLAVFHRAHPRLGTPVLATLILGVVVGGAALALPVATLAEATSTVLLSVFVIVNLSLILLKRRAPEAPFRVAFWVPVLGLILSAGALIASLI